MFGLCFCKIAELKLALKVSDDMGWGRLNENFAIFLQEIKQAIFSIVST